MKFSFNVKPLLPSLFVSLKCNIQRLWIVFANNVIYVLLYILLQIDWLIDRLNDCLKHNKYNFRREWLSR